METEQAQQPREENGGPVLEIRDLTKRFGATLALNIPDFTRFAKTQRDQVIGQSVGLPVTVVRPAMIVGDTDGRGDVFLADQAWLYVTLLSIGYMISRGLAKAGSRARRDA